MNEKHRYNVVASLCVLMLLVFHAVYNRIYFTNNDDDNILLSCGK